MGCSFGYFSETTPSKQPPIEESDGDEFEYTCTNQVYKDFNSKTREFSDKKGTLRCRIIWNGIFKEYKSWVEEDDKLWLWNHTFYENEILKESKYFYRNGNCWSQEIYHDRFNMECKWWHHNNSRIWKHMFRKYEYRDNLKIGRLHGPYKSWYSNGQLAVEQTFENGKINGETTKYEKNGNLA